MHGFQQGASNTGSVRQHLFYAITDDNQIR
jgi:hypothetical protein